MSKVLPFDILKEKYKTRRIYNNSKGFRRLQRQLHRNVAKLVFLSAKYFK